MNNISGLLVIIRPTRLQLQHDISTEFVYSRPYVNAVGLLNSPSICTSGTLCRNNRNFWRLQN